GGDGWPGRRHRAGHLRCRRLARPGRPRDTPPVRRPDRPLHPLRALPARRRGPAPRGHQPAQGGLMDFGIPDEHRALRTAVADVAAGFGSDYYTRKAEAREFTAELWAALGKHGYLGVKIAEEYGGGRGPPDRVPHRC